MESPTIITVVHQGSPESSVFGNTNAVQKMRTLSPIFNLIGGNNFEKSYNYLSANRDYMFTFEQISKVTK
jgi:hypothetical protein